MIAKVFLGIITFLSLTNVFGQKKIRTKQTRISEVRLTIYWKK